MKKEDVIKFVNHLKVSKSLNNKELSKFLGLNPSALDNLKRIKNYSHITQAIKLHESKSISKKQNLEIIQEKESFKEIPFIQTEIFATISPAMSDVVTLQPDTFIKIPMFSRGEYAIQVTGNSMKGFINNGDWAVIRRIYHIDKIIYGECYVIITKDDNLRTVKFLNQDKKDDSILWLSPYNIEQFDSQSIEKIDILELYQVIGIFRRTGS